MENVYDLKLSVSDVIVSKKSSNGGGKLQFFGRDYNFTRTLWAKHIFWLRYSNGNYCCIEVLVAIVKLFFPAYQHSLNSTHVCYTWSKI